MADQSLEEPSEKRRRTSSSNDVQSTFDYKELAKAERFRNTGIVVKMDAKEFTLEYVRQSKLKKPILFTGQLEELGMKVPNFKLQEIDEKMPYSNYYVVDNLTRRTTCMYIKEFIQEFEKDTQTKVLQGEREIYEWKKLASYLQAPSTIRQISWRNTIFPRQKFEDRSLGFVEKYVTVAMAGFYGFFKQNTHGETICIHVQSGFKYYFLIEPTNQNVGKLHYFNEKLNGIDFFGDQASNCTCICVKAGQTLVLPTGWVYASYSTADTIAYEYRFYHDYSLGLQLRLNEERLNVSNDELEVILDTQDAIHYNFQGTAHYYHIRLYQPLLWYLIADVVRKACNREYLRLIHSEEYSELLQQAPDPNKCYTIKLQKSEFYDEADDYQDPIQNTFDTVDKNSKADKIPEMFNDDYLRGWNRDFYTDLSLLHIMFVNIIMDPDNARVGEGIRRPNHLLADFKRVLDRYSELQRADLQPVSWQIKQETTSLDATDNLNTEAIQIDDQEESVLKENDFVIRPDGNTFKIFKVINNHDAEQNELEEINSTEIPQFVDWIRTSYDGSFDEHAEELFKFAVKYNIPDLKNNCINSFKSTLNENNFCQRLILAFEHEDEQFQQQMINSTKQIEGWRDYLYKSDQWNEFNAQNRDKAKMIWNRLSSE